MIIGLRKSIATGMLQVLQTAFACNAQTAIGTWTDDGGYTRSVTVRGAWSTEPEVYPLLSVQARLGRIRGSVGHMVKRNRIVKGQLSLPVYGGVLEGVAIRTTVKTASEDEREQLADLVYEYLWSGVNSASVPYFKMLSNRGIVITDQQSDEFSEQRQQTEEARAPVVFIATLTTLARVEFTAQVSGTALASITLNPVTLTAPSFPLTTE